MKRILLISRCPPYPLYLGDRLILYHLARELSQRGYEIDLLAFTDRAEDWQERPWDDPQVRSYFHEIEIFPEPRRSQWQYLRRTLLAGKRFPRRAEESWSPDMWRAIQQRSAQEQYDLAHLFGGVQIYEFRHALGDLPAIIAPYESYTLYLKRLLENLNPHPPLQAGEGEKPVSSTLFHRGTAIGDRAMTYLQYRMARNFESWMFTPYARTVVVTGRDEDELLSINPALKVEAIPNGIDLDFFQPQDTPREPATLLFTGNYEYAPNVDAALRLATDVLPKVGARLPTSGIAPTLWLVGNAPPPELQRVASDGVIVTGRVPDVRPYLARATLFVSPLRLGAGIKNKVLEALAMGLTVVATPLSVDGIAVQHEREVLIAESDDDLVESIVRLLGDSALRAQLSATGRVLIEEQYSWSRVATAYEALYDAVGEELKSKTRRHEGTEAQR